MPNGDLEPYYGSKPLSAGKNPGKARFNFEKLHQFKSLADECKTYSRIKIIYFDLEKCRQKQYDTKLKFLIDMHKNQS